MKSLISKTTFLSFLECYKNVWFRMHRPEEAGKLQLSDFELHILEQGNEVEAEARKLFPEAILVTATGDEAVEETNDLIKQKSPSIFQATFVVDGFIAKCDVLVYNPREDNWDLYEVKGTNSVKEDSGSHRDHIDDLAFQLSVLRRAAVVVGRCFVIHLNKEYVRSGAISLKALFLTDDVTEKVAARFPEIESKMALALEYLASEKEPLKGCECIYKARKKHCSTFQYSNPRVPAYSVHDLSRINAKKLDLLIEREILDLKDIPDDFELSAIQRNQVIAYQKQRPIIDEEAIEQELRALSFPLYFFDYEAFGPAIPAFDGYGPYKHIPFQFSLHTLRAPDAPLEHFEFLHDTLSDPSNKVSELLQKHIPPGGTVIVWHKTFEKMVDKEIGIRLPKYAAYFEEFNERIYDLKEIFSNQQYIHHGFQGRSSIKKVLPILAAECRYDSLNIREGGQAADAWWRMVAPETSAEEKAQIGHDLKIYCGLDTYAMYAIWHHLQEVVSEGPVQAKSLYPPIHG